MLFYKAADLKLRDPLWAAIICTNYHHLVLLHLKADHNPAEGNITVVSLTRPIQWDGMRQDICQSLLNILFLVLYKNEKIQAAF